MAIRFFQFLQEQRVHSAVQPTLSVREAAASEQPMKTARYVRAAVLHDQSRGRLRESVLDAGDGGLLIPDVDNTRAADTSPKRCTHRLLHASNNHKNKIVKPCSRLSTVRG